MSWSVVAGAGNSFAIASSAANTFSEVSKDNGYVLAGYVVNDYIDFGESWSGSGGSGNVWISYVSSPNTWSAA